MPNRHIDTNLRRHTQDNTSDYWLASPSSTIQARWQQHYNWYRRLYCMLPVWE